MAVVGEPEKAPTSSYLKQFLSRRAERPGEDERRDVQQAVEDIDSTNGDANSNKGGEEVPCTSHLNDNRHDHRQPGDHDGNIDAAINDAVPRSPPRPQPPPALSGPLRWTLDSSAVLDDGDGPAQVVMLRRGLDSSTRHTKRHNGCSTPSGHNYRRPESREEQRDLGFMVGEGDTLQPGEGAAFSRSYSAIAASRVRQERQELAGSAYSSLRRRPQGCPSKPPGGRQPDHQRRTVNGSGTGKGNGDGDGRALGVRESSALFWEESDSLDAKSSGAFNERGLVIARGGRAAAAAAVGGGGRGGRGEAAIAPFVRRGRASTAVVGRGQGAEGRGQRVDVRLRTAATTAVIGGVSIKRSRRRHPRAVLTSPEELPLGQALRTVGGLLGGDGAKVSAVSSLCFFAVSRCRCYIHTYLHSPMPHCRCCKMSALNR